MKVITPVNCSAKFAMPSDCKIKVAKGFTVVIRFTFFISPYCNISYFEKVMFSQWVRLEIAELVGSTNTKLVQLGAGCKFVTSKRAMLSTSKVYSKVSKAS